MSGPGPEGGTHGDLRRQLQNALAALEGLTPACGVADSPTGRALRTLLLELLLLCNGAPPSNAEKRARRAWQALQLLALRAGHSDGVALTPLLVDALLADQHLFLDRAQHCDFVHLAPDLVTLIRQDLHQLQQVAQVDLPTALERMLGHRPAIGGAVATGAPEGDGRCWPWEQLAEERQQLKALFADADEWANLAEPLAEYVRGHGIGVYSSGPAFRLKGATGEVRLEPIQDFAGFPLAWLEGNEQRIGVVRQNTENLLAGHRAHHVLIWGPRGCGKSSLIRGLISDYYRRGLRGVEIHPRLYGQLDGLYELVRGRPEFFIGVLDNIALSRHEPDFRLLASALDGHLAQVPQNLVFYATSNFKDLIDREGERPEGLGRLQLDEEIPNLVNQGMRPAAYDPQQAERLDEQRALDDRFALKVFMDLPRKSEYEAMVVAYARRAGLNIPDPELLAAFNVWRMRHNHDLVGGRTARDFVIALAPRAAGQAGLSTP